MVLEVYKSSFTQTVRNYLISKTDELRDHNIYIFLEIDSCQRKPLKKLKIVTID